MMGKNDYSFLRDLNIIYIEVTNKCNLCCKYCYAIQRKLPARMMDFSLFKRIVDLVAINSRQKHMSIVFHGGEPLLAQPEFFVNSMSYAEDCFAREGKTVDFGLQSNLLRLSDAMIEILKRFNVKVSTSVDGPEKVHNKARGGWKQTVSNFEKIRLAGIPINFIAVCSQHNKNCIESLFVLAKDMGFSSLQLNIASSPQLVDPVSLYCPLSADEIYGIFRECLSLTEKYGIVEKKTSSMVRYFLESSGDRMRQLCCDSPFCHAGTHMLVFTPDGMIYPCSPAVPLSMGSDGFLLGSINDGSEFFFKTLASFHEKGEKYSTQCINCAAAKICDFGCPAFDRIDPVTAENHCQATKKLYDYFLQLGADNLKSLNYESDPD